MWHKWNNATQEVSLELCVRPGRPHDVDCAQNARSTESHKYMYYCNVHRPSFHHPNDHKVLVVSSLL